MGMKFNSANPIQYNGMTQQAIINGNFDRWERGTSFTNPATGSYLADKWIMFNNGSGLPTTVIPSRQILTSGDIANAYYFFRINASDAGSNTCRYRFEQHIENGTKYLCGLGKRVTVSFWARSSIAGKKLGVELNQSYGTGGSPSTSEDINGTNFTLTSTWARYSYTFTTNTLVSKIFGTNNDDVIGFRFGVAWDTATAIIWGAGTTAETFVGSGNIDIAQVQINAGDSALTFQPKNISNEISDCQRFAIAYTDANTSFPVGNGFAISTTVARIQVELPQAMRIAPNLTATATDWQLSDGVTATDLTAISIVSGQVSNKTITLLCTVASGLTQFRPYQLIADGTANRLMVFDAEI